MDRTQQDVLVERANEIGVKLLGRRLLVKSVENKVAVCYDPAHPSNVIKVSTETVVAALWRTGHWLPIGR